MKCYHLHLWFIDELMYVGFHLSKDTVVDELMYVQNVGFHLSKDTVVPLLLRSLPPKVAIRFQIH